MNGKNDLERFAIDDFRELAEVGSTSQINFVVQMGRPIKRKRGQRGLGRVYDGWSGARRFLVTLDQTPANGSELEIVGGRSIDMGDASTLKEFLQWGRERFPAKRYAVIVWNHGQGYRLTAAEADAAAREPTDPDDQPDNHMAPTHRAVSSDGDTGSIIYNTDVRASLSGVFGAELRLVGFDACLMAMLKTAYELKGITPLVVASEELEPGSGWNYATWARAITGAPTSDEAKLGSMLVASYRDQYGHSNATTLSLIRSEMIGSVASELSRLSDLILADRDALFPLMKTARESRGAYNDPENPVSVDLIGLLNAFEREVRREAPGSPVLAQTQETRATVQASIVESYASRERGEPYGSYGLAIYFPASKRAFTRDGWSAGYIKGNAFKQIAFVERERWSQLLAGHSWPVT